MLQQQQQHQQHQRGKPVLQKKKPSKVNCGFLGIITGGFWLFSLSEEVDWAGIS
jgi:hypothetical protein